MSVTVRNLIYDSLLLIGVIASGETPKAAEEADALRALTRMLDSWSLDGFLIPYRTIESFSILSSKQTYTMGPDVSADFNTARPSRILSIGVTTNGAELPVNIITLDEWSQIIVKSITSTIPTRAYIEGTAPLEKINFWPIPLGTTSVEIYSEKIIGGYSAVNDTVTLPPGYAQPIIYNLGGTLCPFYGKSVTPEIAAVATESLAMLRRHNTEPVFMESDAAGISGSRPFNYITGE